MPRLELVETSLGQGQEALLISRLRRRHAIPIAELLDRCGVAVLDVLGGPSFEACLRFLAEDPLARLRAIRAAAPTTTLMARVAGQSLMGHRHVADDIVDIFMRVIADAGVDLVRCHDPLNDTRNLERVLAAAAAAGLATEAVIVHPGRPDGDDEPLAAVARELARIGYERLCLHDPQGVLGMARTQRLVGAIREASGLPVGLSVVDHSGLAPLTYLAAIQAGADRLDVALGPLAGGAAFPALEALIEALADSDWDLGVDPDAVRGAADALDRALAHYVEIRDPAAARPDTAALRGHLPAWSMGHALVELRDRGALDRLAEVVAEIATVRQDLGDPPMISPLAEIIAVQAAYNVLDGERYASISQEVKDYCLGLYGRPPAPIADSVRRVVNGREEPITCRPADLLEPGRDEALRELESAGISDPDEATVAVTALFPTEAIAVVRGEAVGERLGDEPPSPPASAPAPPSPEVAASPELTASEPADEVRELTVEVDGESYTVRVSGPPGTFGGGAGGGGAGASVAAPARPRVREGTVVAPMQGLILRVAVAVGDVVGLGDVVAVLEAMKMQNDVTATKAGRVSEIYVAEGTVVSPRDPLLQIGD